MLCELLAELQKIFYKYFCYIKLSCLLESCITKIHLRYIASARVINLNYIQADNLSAFAHLILDNYYPR